MRVALACMFVLVRRKLIHFAYYAMLYVVHICFGSKKVLAWYSWFYKNIFSCIVNLFTIVPYFSEKYNEVCRRLSSHLKWVTYKDLHTSWKDGSSIIVGYRIEPILERLNTLMDLFIRNYVLFILCNLFILVPLFISDSDGGGLIQGVIFVRGCIIIIKQLSSLFCLRKCGHLTLDSVYLLSLFALDAALVFCMNTLSSSFLAMPIWQKARSIGLSGLFFLLLFLFTLLFLLVSTLRDFVYVMQVGISIDLQQLWDEKKYSLKIKFNGILFNAKVGFFYLDFRDDCVWLRRPSEIPYKIPYSSIDDIEIVGDDLWNVDAKKVLSLKSSII